MTPRQAFISINDLSKTFADGVNGVKALASINMAVERNSFVSLVGRSGCGKSTLLRLICGLETPTIGCVRVDGLTPERFGKSRPFGVVFQDAALLPWKTTLENIRLPLDILGTETRVARNDRARRFLALVRLDGFADAYPAQLSGGMRQRAAIARALAYQPEVLLMDEPFGALDDFTRREMGDELLRIWSQQRCTVIFVTHSLSEAVLLSDHVVVLKPRPGRVDRIVQVDLPRPRDAAVRHIPAFSAHVAVLESLIFGHPSAPAPADAAGGQ